MRPGGSTSKLSDAFGCAFEGVVQASRERNFRIELCFACAAIALGVAFHISIPEWLAVVICIGLVLGAECMNTALEAAVDLAMPNQHDLAKRAKDAAAGCVLLFSLASFVVGVVLYAPRLLGLLF